MALIEAVFKRSGDQRTMSFQTIAEETRLPQDEVEHLVMKALRCVTSVSLLELVTNAQATHSLKLIKGTIDQVDQKAQIVWVQPRVLSRQQIGELADRLGAWCGKLAKVEQFIHNQQAPLTIQ